VVGHDQLALLRGDAGCFPAPPVCGDEGHVEGPGEEDAFEAAVPEVSLFRERGDGADGLDFLR